MDGRLERREDCCSEQVNRVRAGKGEVTIDLSLKASNLVRIRTWLFDSILFSNGPGLLCRRFSNFGALIFKLLERSSFPDILEIPEIPTAFEASNMSAVDLLLHVITF
jgi:hypothetical protein